MALRPIYYDTETTGIKPAQDRIVEIAAYDPVLDLQFVSLVQPGCPIPTEAAAIHGISNEMVASAPTFAEVGQAFIDFCSGEVVLIAHNGDSFDLPFLRYECERNKLSLPACKTLDTLKWARRYRPDLPRHSLQILREVYGIPPNTAHRALDDVIVLHRLFQLMIDDLTIEDVYNLLCRPRTLQHMPFGKHQGQPLNQIPRTYVRWLLTSGALEKPENQELKESFSQLGLLVATEL